MQPLIVLEMNEVNFEYVQWYVQNGYLKNFSAFFDKHGFFRTTSETRYEILEPWIQWVSARTGKTFKQHEVFRLGDIVDSDVEQHWEQIEAKGYSVAAVSPINAANRTRQSPFWMPDPWVATPSSGGKQMSDLAKAIKQAVNDNASAKLSASTKGTLVKALLSMSSRRGSWSCYLSALRGILKRQHWSKAILLDRLLADVFFSLWKRHKPDFATLFLNSAAHIQHHYMFNSGACDSKTRNPSWYIAEKADPVLEIYSLYDRILEEAMASGARVMVATGLRQVPYEDVTFYYRLKSHEEFLGRVGVPFCNVLPRMSRDFLIECASSVEAVAASEQLEALQSDAGERIFEVDNRGCSLFVTLVYSHEIRPSFSVRNGQGLEVIADFHDVVAFVAIKNGHHDSVGYFMDSAMSGGLPIGTFPLEDLHARVLDHFR